MKIKTTIKVQNKEFTGIVNIKAVVENIEKEDIEDFKAGNQNDEVRNWVDYQMSETSKIKASYKNGILIGTYTVGREFKVEIELDYSSMVSDEEIENLDKDTWNEIANELIIESKEIVKVA